MNEQRTEPKTHVTLPYHTTPYAILRFWFFSKHKKLWKKRAAFIPDNFVTFFNTPNDRFHPRNCRAGTLCRFNTLQPLIMRYKLPRLIHTDAAKWKDTTLDLFTAKYPKYLLHITDPTPSPQNPHTAGVRYFRFLQIVTKPYWGGGPPGHLRYEKLGFFLDSQYKCLWLSL